MLNIVGRTTEYEYATEIVTYERYFGAHDSPRGCDHNTPRGWEWLYSDVNKSGCILMYRRKIS